MLECNLTLTLNYVTYYGTLNLKKNFPVWAGWEGGYSDGRGSLEKDKVKDDRTCWMSFRTLLIGPHLLLVQELRIMI